jgi:hypothetical protein
MVAVTIDGPLGEYDVGIFDSQGTSEILIMRGIHKTTAIILTGKSRVRSEDMTCSLGFGGPNRCTAVETRAATEPLTAIQIE